MAFEIYYTIPFSDVVGNEYLITLAKDATAPDEVIELLGAARPFQLKYQAQQDKQYPTFTLSEATISFYNRDGAEFDLLSLVNGDDFQWQVNLIKVAANDLLWAGFLDVNSCQEDLQDNPRFIQLRATDGIGLLKNIPFSDTSDLDVYDKKTLLDCIGYCLLKTGIGLDLVIEVNLFEASQDDRADSLLNDAFAQTKVHTRSFMKDGNEFMSCYDVIEAICKSFNATFTQAHGEWHIIRYPDRWQNFLYGAYGASYPTPYVAVTADANRAYSYEFVIQPPGDGFEHILIDADATREYLPPVKCGIATYRIQIPEDLPKNKNFRYGNFSVLDSSSTISAFTIDDWAYIKRNTGSDLYTLTVAGEQPRRIEERDAFGKLIDAYVRLPKETSTPLDAYEKFESSYIDVQKGDKFSFSFSTREKDNRSSFTGFINAAQIIIYDESDVPQYYLKPDGSWFYSPNAVNGTFSIIARWNNLNTNEWLDIIVDDCDELPIDGRLKIGFLEWSWANAGNKTYIKDFRIDFQYRLGSSSGVTGIRSKMCQTGDYRQNAETEIMLADSPKKIFTGALFTVADDYKLTTKWHQYNVTEDRELVEILARDLFRARCRVRTIINGTTRTITTADPRFPASLHQVIISPLNIAQIAATPNKYYIFVNLDIDIRNCSAKFIAQELFDSVLDDPAEDGNSWNYQTLFG